MIRSRSDEATLEFVRRRATLPLARIPVFWNPVTWTSSTVTGRRVAPPTLVMSMELPLWQPLPVPYRMLATVECVSEPPAPLNWMP